MESPGKNDRLEARLDSVLKKIRSQLESEQHRIYQEIKNYPKPIPACDGQFNYLLETRSGIAADLERLQSIVAGSFRGPEAIRLMEEFVRSSPYLGDKLKEHILSELKEKSADLQL